MHKITFTKKSNLSILQLISVPIYPTIHPDTHLARNKSKLQNTQMQNTTTKKYKKGNFQVVLTHMQDIQVPAFFFFTNSYSLILRQAMAENRIVIVWCLQEHHKIAMCANLKRVRAHFSKVLRIGFCGKFSMNNLTRNAILKQSLLKWFENGIIRCHTHANACYITIAILH